MDIIKKEKEQGHSCSKPCSVERKEKCQKRFLFRKPQEATSSKEEGRAKTGFLPVEVLQTSGVQIVEQDDLLL